MDQWGKSDPSEDSSYPIHLLKSGCHPCGNVFDALAWPKKQREHRIS